MSPTVSVVTVNRNMAPGLKSTLQSVLAQDYADFEAVVIDGASSDGSRDVLASFAPKLAHGVSEPDRGLYDAMNKGVAAANSDWVIFMNAGDVFAAPDVLSKIFARPHDGADVLYGHHIRRYEKAGVTRQVPAEPPSVLPWRMHASHQAVLMRRELLLAHPFDISLLAADYEVLLAAFAAGKSFEAVDVVIASTEMGGRSDTARLKSLRQRMTVLRRYGLMTRRLAIHYRKLMARAVLAQIAKALLPRAAIAAILRRRPIRGLE